MDLILRPVKFKEQIIQTSVKTKKYIYIGKDKILINNIRLSKVIKAYPIIRGEEITQAKVKEFIDNF